MVLPRPALSCFGARFVGAWVSDFRGFGFSVLAPMLLWGSTCRGVGFRFPGVLRSQFGHPRVQGEVVHRLRPAGRVPTRKGYPAQLGILCGPTWSQGAKPDSTRGRCGSHFEFWPLLFRSRLGMDHVSNSASSVALAVTRHRAGRKFQKPNRQIEAMGPDEGWTRSNLVPSVALVAARFQAYCRDSPAPGSDEDRA